jgi:hypothetical protein
VFVGWLRKGSFESDLEEFSKDVVVDKNLIKNSVENPRNISFGAYEKDRLVGFLTSHDFDKAVMINGFYYLDSGKEDVVKRLLAIFLDNINIDKTILFMSRKDEIENFLNLGFKMYAKFYKALYSGGADGFNYSTAIARSISSQNYLQTLRQVDFFAYEEDRFEYITRYVMKDSSLMFASNRGYQHSYGVGKNLVKISPWVVDEFSFMDAENMMKGLIYHRGLKKIFSFVPSDIKEIVDLYKSYKFEFVEEYTLIYLNDKPKYDLNMIYAF